MLIYVPRQDTGQHYGGRWARPSAAQRSRPLSQRSTNLGIFVLSRKPPCGRVRETRNNKRNLKLPRIKQSYAFMFSAASLWNRLPDELLYLDVFRKQTYRIEICKLWWTVFSNSLVSLSSNSCRWIIVFWLIFVFFINFFWGPRVDYREILSATLNKKGLLLSLLSLLFLLSLSLWKDRIKMETNK